MPSSRSGDHRVTIYDVATKAGVSHATVTRFFRQPEKLSARTYRRVEAVVNELHYVPNAAARSLSSGRTNLVALVVTDITSAFYTTIMHGVEATAQSHGYTLILVNTDESVEKERALLDALIAHRIDGVILTPAQGEGHDLSQLERHGIAVVLIDRELPNGRYDLVHGDSYEAGRTLTHHLLDQGLRDIAFVGGPEGVSSLEQRLKGYTDAMTAAGHPLRVHLGTYSRQSGEAIFDALATDDTLPEAIVAASNKVALGVLVAARRHGIRIPDDVAVACVDDLETASLIDPFLTVAAQPAYDIGQLAMEMLIERIEGKTYPARKVMLPVELIVRRSSVRTATSEA
ncbi:MAG: LacI family DNA-binding transcriptional regulator [Bacteroidota bacterium]